MPPTSRIVTNLALAILGSLYDAKGWPMFHSWGLIHGSWLIAWPMLSLICLIGLVIGQVFWAAAQGSWEGQ